MTVWFNWPYIDCSTVWFCHEYS